MPLSAYQRPVIGLSTAVFTEGLAQNEISANYDMPLPERNAWWFIKGFTLIAVQNLNYELWLFSSATNMQGTVDDQKLVGFWQFGAQTGAQDPGAPVTGSPGGDALFNFYIDGNMIPYRDADYGLVQQPNLHIRLVNRSAGAKNAGPTGAVNLTVWCAPQGMQA